MFVEFNVNGHRMKITGVGDRRLAIWLRKRVFFFFTAWEVIAIAEGQGANAMFTTFFNEAKTKAKPILSSKRR